MSWPRRDLRRKLVVEIYVLDKGVMLHWTAVDHYITSNITLEVVS